MRFRMLAAAVITTWLPAVALAQSAPGTPKAPAPPVGLAPTPLSVGAAKPKTAVPSNCFRLPLSDVAFGKDGATREARIKLDEYAQAQAKKRNWPAGPLVKSNETVSCEVYLDLGLLGTEYRCLVTTTFCRK